MPHGQVELQVANLLAKFSTCQSLTYMYKAKSIFMNLFYKILYNLFTFIYFYIILFISITIDVDYVYDIIMQY